MCQGGGIDRGVSVRRLVVFLVCGCGLVCLDKMDLKKKIDDFRQLQAHRKSLKNCNIEIKVSFNARVKIEQGLPTFAAVITFTQASAISIMETNKPNGFHRRALHILKEEVETYDSADNTLEINYQVDVAKQNPLIIFDSTDERKSFEVSFRTFIEYSNPAQVNP